MSHRIYDPAPPGSPPHPPPKGGIGHTYAAMYRYNYMFVLIYVCMPVCLTVCLLVCKYVRVPARSTCHCFLCLHTKILHVHTMFPPPPCGWVGGVLPSAAIYRYNYMFSIDLCMITICFVLIYGLFVCMYIRVQARSTCHCFCVCTQRYYMYT